MKSQKTEISKNGQPVRRITEFGIMMENWNIGNIRGREVCEELQEEGRRMLPSGSEVERPRSAI